ncbi:MAG: Na/Pi cotransporter family protein [Bacteroidales bacterium]|nr:Na/Pi cotransporter family protein [Bacteroidales bacterium]
MIQILSIIGSIALFLFALKIMSEGLQKIVGDRLRSMLSVITRNRFSGMLAGTLVTALVQSSKATMVTIVSFVNAGIISLKQSIPVVMGANVGTTVTTWLIAFFGFYFNLEWFLLPLIALAMPLQHTKQPNCHNWGDFLMGFSLLFLAISILKNFMPLADNFPQLATMLSNVCHMGILSSILALLFGLLLTVSVQASSVAFTLTLMLCVCGWIQMNIALAIIVGCNIGTCITPLVMSLSANTMAKRSAVGHLCFNLLGTIWAIPLIFFFVNEEFCPMLCRDISPRNMALCLAMFHTLFNIVNVALQLGFTHWMAEVITWLIPDNSNKDESFKLKFIGNGYVESGEIALLQVRKETSRYANDTCLMFNYVKTMMSEQNSSENLHSLFHTIRMMEQKSDAAEEEIANYLNKISPKSLSADSDLLSRSYYKMIDELESIADSIYHMSCTLSRKQEHRIRFSIVHQRKLQKMIQLTDAALAHMVKCLEHESLSESALNKAYNMEDEINNYRTQMRNEMLEQKATDYEQTTYFMELINECERVGDYVINVLTALAEN